jgi:uncharacterized membrane protein
MVRDQATKYLNRMDVAMDKAARDTRNRLRGRLAEMSARLSDETTPDWILEERVRTSLGRMPENARGVTVTADGGRISLTGPVLRREREAVVRAATRTRGVYGVDDQLQLVDSPENIPALQAEMSSERGTQGEWAQRSWSPAARTLSSIGGSLLTLYGLTRRGIAKPILTTAGLALTTRGLTNLDTRSLLGMGEHGIRVNKAINIDAPIDEVYHFWRDFEHFPRFMSHVQEITAQGDVSHWRVAGPAGSTFEFQSHITRDVPNQVIVWETLPDSQIHHSGFVHFDENRDGTTRVTVQMEYIPPAGAIGHAVAQLFGDDPRQAMNEDLMRLKTLLEQGRTSTIEGTVSYQEFEDRP